MLSIGIFALVIVLGVLALIPKMHDAMRRHKRVVVIVVIAYIALIFLHPYLFGLPGRVREMMFVSKVHDGMTKRELLTLADQYGGHGPLNGPNSPIDDLRGNTVVIQFENTATLCFGGGDEFVFRFSMDDLLEGWKENGWENGC